MYRLKDKLCFLLLFITISASGFALPSDKEKVMHITADSANLSQLHHKGTYRGNVAFTQGSTNLLANNALTQTNVKNQLTLAIANGSPGKQAHYWTQTDPNKPLLHAYADTIRYFPLRHCIELIGNAHVEQGSNSLSAAKITYDTLKHHVVSQGNEQTKVIIIIYPENKSI